jgi:hypothetical protein
LVTQENIVASLYKVVCGNLYIFYENLSPFYEKITHAKKNDKQISCEVRIYGHECKII